MYQRFVEGATQPTNLFVAQERVNPHSRAPPDTFHLQNRNKFNHQLYEWWHGRSMAYFLELIAVLHLEVQFPNGSGGRLKRLNLVPVLRWEGGLLVCTYPPTNR